MLERDRSFQISSVINLCAQMRLTLVFKSRNVQYASVPASHWVRLSCVIEGVFKETVHPEINIVSSFIHPLVNADLYDCLSFFHRVHLDFLSISYAL